MTNKLAVSSGFFREPSVEKWKSLIRAGITDVELGLSKENNIQSIIEKAEQDYTMLSDSAIVVSSVHLPFGDLWDISALDDSIYKNSIEGFKKLIDWASKKDIGIAVLHASYEPIEDSDRSERLERSAEGIKILGAYGKDRNVSLAVENLPRTCLGNCGDEINYLTNNGKNAGVCFDVNHLLIESHKDFMKKVGPHIITTHFSDYDGLDEKHWLVGEGCINWPELIQGLQDLGYKGRYLFELNELCLPDLGRPLKPSELVERFMKTAQID